MDNVDREAALRILFGRKTGAFSAALFETTDMVADNGFWAVHDKLEPAGQTLSSAFFHRKTHRSGVLPLPVVERVAATLIPNTPCLYGSQVSLPVVRSFLCSLDKVPDDNGWKDEWFVLTQTFRYFRNSQLCWFCAEDDVRKSRWEERFFSHGWLATARE